MAGHDAPVGTTSAHPRQAISPAKTYRPCPCTPFRTLSRHGARYISAVDLGSGPLFSRPGPDSDANRQLGCRNSSPREGLGSVASPECPSRCRSASASPETPGSSPRHSASSFARSLLPSNARRGGWASRRPASGAGLPPALRLGAPAHACAARWAAVCRTNLDDADQMGLRRGEHPRRCNSGLPHLPSRTEATPPTLDPGSKTSFVLPWITVSSMRHLLSKCGMPVRLCADPTDV